MKIVEATYLTPQLSSYMMSENYVTCSEVVKKKQVGDLPEDAPHNMFRYDSHYFGRWDDVSALMEALVNSDPKKFKKRIKEYKGEEYSVFNIENASKEDFRNSTSTAFSGSIVFEDLRYIRTPPYIFPVWNNIAFREVEYAHSFIRVGLYGGKRVYLSPKYLVVPPIRNLTPVTQEIFSYQDNVQVTDEDGMVSEYAQEIYSYLNSFRGEQDVRRQLMDLIRRGVNFLAEWVTPETTGGRFTGQVLNLLCYYTGDCQVLRLMPAVSKGHGDKFSTLVLDASIRENRDLILNNDAFIGEMWDGGTGSPEDNHNSGSLRFKVGVVLKEKFAEGVVKF